MSESGAITMENGQLNVPNEPIVHYIEGDGIGVDITPVMISVVDAAVNKAYGALATSIGRKFSQARRHSTQQASGYQKQPSKPCEQASSQSRAP